MQMQSSCLALYSVGYEGNDRENVVVLDNVFLLLFKVQSQGWNIKKKKKKKKKKELGYCTITIVFHKKNKNWFFLCEREREI